MTGRSPTSTGSHLSNSSEGTNCGTNQLKPGDIAWVEIHDGSWWPAQVVDEENLNFKGKKKAENEVLVRLYGTYDYFYVDPIKSSTGFQNFLKQENCSMREAFQKALEEDISHMKSAGNSKRKHQTSKAGTSEGKKQKQDHVVIDLDSDDSASQELPSGVPKKAGTSQSKGKSGKRKEASGGPKGKGDDTVDETPKKNKRKQEGDSVDRSAKKTKLAEASKAKNSNSKAAKGNQKEKDENKGKASKNVKGRQEGDSKERSAEKTNVKEGKNGSSGVKREKDETNAKASKNVKGKKEGDPKESAEKTNVEDGKNGSSGLKNKKQAVARSKIRAIEEHLKTKSPASKTPTSTKGETQEGTPDSSSRRVRVMRDMGLIPPLGSPYR